MIHLLEAHGVHVFSLAEEVDSVDAFSLWRSETPYVFLSTKKSAERSRMDAAHELGHLVIHGRHQRSRGREVEHEALSFGAAFLMPEGDLKARLPMGGTLRELVVAKKRWNVSAASLVYRLHGLGLISDWQYRMMFQEISRKGYRKNEPRGSQRETSQVLVKVLGVLRAEGVTTAHMATELGISQEDLNALMFGLVLTVVDGGSEATSTLRRPELRVV
jgi:Zn-dependent peptidase ImmA (M78 family)